MKPVRFDYLKAKDAQHVLQLLHQHGDEAKCIAGGQSLGPMLNLRLARPKVLIDLHAAADLQTVEQSADQIMYGSAIRHAQLEDGVVPDASQGLLRAAAGLIGYRAIRNRGTIGGSIAHADPAADWIGIMVGLDATYHLQTRKKQRRVLASNFMSAAFMTELAADEIITAISIPKLSAAAQWGYYKFSRKATGYSESTGIVVADPERGYCRVLLAALDVPPVALENVANALAEHGVAAAMAEVSPDIERLLEGYSPVKKQLFKVVIERALAQLGSVQ
jgi:carbon-monoxide dehydrogenase medium subunit